jgi:DNA sulfur modification protein DndB
LVPTRSASLGDKTEPFTYVLWAIRGIQAGREYYVAMCPLKLIPKLFLYDEEELPGELRAQRTLNRARVPEIAKYITDNPKEYVFSSITASVDSEVSFRPAADTTAPAEVGQLIIPMTARFIINDGQHRRAGIEEALKIHQPLRADTEEALTTDQYHVIGYALMTRRTHLSAMLSRMAPAKLIVEMADAQ